MGFRGLRFRGFRIQGLVLVVGSLGVGSRELRMMVWGCLGFGGFRDLGLGFIECRDLGLRV